MNADAQRSEAATGATADALASAKAQPPIVATWRYQQTTGKLWHYSELVGEGYAGFGEGLNNHAAEGIPNMGPIPVGFYSIGPAFPHPKAGPVTMRLTPLPGTDTHGRDGFLMHGDSASLDHTASHGCIVQIRATREIVAAAPDRILEVIP